MKLTIDEYAKKFKMSKEMVASKLKLKKIDYIIEEGETYIIINENSVSTPQTQNDIPIKTNLPAKPKTTVATVLALYQRENKQLKEKIIKLELKIDKLIEDKEQMLREERDRIEAIYSNKDVQLKNILELINSKLMLEHQNSTIHDVETFHEPKKVSENKNGLIELKEYLKTLDLKSYQRKVIKNRFLAVYDSDIRIIHQNGKLYLNFDKYDYTDLLEY
jgi:hypothetical protein